MCTLAGKLVGNAPADAAAMLLQKMDYDNAAKVLKPVPANRAAAILGILSPEWATAFLNKAEALRSARVFSKGS